MSTLSRIPLARLRSSLPSRVAPFIHRDLLAAHSNRLRISTAATVPTRLSLTTGGFIIPHPQKVAKGGEDAYYIAERSFGVADGVGGWAEMGIDSGQYARTVMREAKAALDVRLKAAPDQAVDPAGILQTASGKSQRIIGSSTACVICVDEEKLNAANIGDSGFLVVRAGQLHFSSTPQQHRFNFPYQIGTHGDPVSSCQKYSVDIEAGDVIIAGTDGLLDNVFNERSAKLVWDAKSRGATPGVAAQQLAMLASARAFDPLYQSPFAKAAMQSGFFYRGGKVDDITVVIAYVLADTPTGASDTQASLDSADSAATAAAEVPGAAAVQAGAAEVASVEVPGAKMVVEAQTSGDSEASAETKESI